MDRRAATALGLQPGDDLVERLAIVHTVEAAAVHHCAVAGAWELAAVDHPADRQVEPLRELEVALVMPWHGHDRPCAVLEEHVVRDEDGDLLEIGRAHV